MREYENRSPCDLNTEFTEHSIGAASDTGLLKNSSTRSVILCPFNSRQADVTEQGRLLEYCLPLMEDKDIMLRFGIRVRELDRAYEKFNNQDFDNGVYHKYAYKNQGNKGEDKKDEEEGQNKPSNSPRSKTRQTILQRILEEDKVILPKRVMTPESEKYAKIGKTYISLSHLLLFWLIYLFLNWLITNSLAVFLVLDRYGRGRKGRQLWLPAKHHHKQLAEKLGESLHDFVLLAAHGASLLNKH